MAETYKNQGEKSLTTFSIKLPGGEWDYDDSDHLGKAGGFGEVFLGKGSCGDVAVKRLKINADQAAHRELKIGQRLQQNLFDYIVPILDAGQDAESNRYYLIMPVCNFSLQDKIDETKCPVNVKIAKDAILAIIAGLAEVSDITHRDLKPANILFHEGSWKIADFGIAKFVEDSTSLETLRESLTPTYAAPEQWKGERPTSATDVYALGCIIHSLFTGNPPFNGSIDDIRESHLHKAPSQIPELPPRFAAFVSQMLRKPPGARPTLERCKTVLSGLDLDAISTNAGHPLIDNAAKQVAEREAEQEAKQHAAETMRNELQELFDDARTNFNAIKDSLFSKIQESSENVTIDHRGLLRFGEAVLDLTVNPSILEEFVLSRHARGGKPYNYTRWDVLGWSMIKLKCNRTNYTWSASLLFANLNDGNGFRWYELAFWSMVRSKSKDEPFGLEGYHADIDLACGNITHATNVAYGPLSIDSEDEEEFIQRWLNLVAKAAIGELKAPDTMPIRNFK